ncbi:MAG: carbohydrate ABC transporter permease [Spirochaetales bacterium]|nr:carbohydrate ABC transporter permease [Spirochaetales bacterium]
MKRASGGDARRTRRGSRILVRAVLKTPLHAVIVVICFLWLLPSLGLFVSSLRPRHLIQQSGWWTAFETPFQFTLDNYSHVIESSNMGRSFINSLLIAVPATVFPTVIAVFTAYAFSRLKFFGRDAVFLVIVGLLVVPIQMTLIPVLRVFNQLRLTGTFLGVWLAHAAYGLPFAIYLLRNFIDELPVEMFESAQMDGASHFRIIVSLVIPTSVPALASLAIFQFMWVWNDLLVALIYLGGTPDVAPMTVTISHLVSSQGSGWEYLTAAAFISMLLPMIVFFSLQKYFIRGIVAGSVKG